MGKEPALKGTADNEELVQEYKSGTAVEDGSEVNKPKHGPHWLVGRSGKCKKMMKATQPKLSSSSSTLESDGLKKSMMEEIMTEMKEMVQTKVCEKINPNFKHLDVEELCAASGDESKDNDQEQEDDDCDDEEEETDE